METAAGDGRKPKKYDFCRACLALRPLVAMMPNVKAKFSQFTQIDMSGESHLCYECINRLENAFNFRLQCVQVDRHLKEQGSQEDDYVVLVNPPAESSNGDTETEKSTNKEPVSIVIKPRPQEIIEKIIEKEEDVDDPSTIDTFDVSNAYNVETLIEENNTGDEPLILCDCGQTFFKVDECESHPHDNFTCLECSEAFDSKQAIVEHMSTHRSKDTLVGCKFCDMKVRLGNLTVHIQMNHSIPPPLCNLCKKTFLTDYSLKRHIRRVHERRDKVHREKYACLLCHRRFMTETELDEHNTLHRKNAANQLKQARYLQSKASKDVTDPLLLDGEELDYNEESPPLKPAQMKPTSSASYESLLKKKRFICTLCNREFKSLSMLNLHALIHNDRPYRCKKCSARFKTKKNVIAHQAVHSERQNFKCPICKNNFTFKGNLMEHIHKMHQDNILNVPLDLRITEKQKKKKTKKEEATTSSTKKSWAKSTIFIV